MFLQRPMFQGSSTISQLEKIFEFTGKPVREDLHFVKNEESLRIIDSMECKERRSIRDVLPNEDKNMVDLLDKIFQVNPNKRPTADEIMKHPFLTRFRGRVCEKLPEKPIKIQYDRKLLTIDDYKSLLYGDLEEKDVVVDVRARGTEEAGMESNIYKTVPNHVGRNNFMHNYPWGNLENKSPMHTSNLNQKSLSPLARVKKDGFASPMPLLTVPEVDAKIERHSPSFLNLKKKENSPAKVTPKSA
jgi:serine/threonine protein kinase